MLFHRQFLDTNGRQEIARLEATGLRGNALATAFAARTNTTVIQQKAVAELFFLGCAYAVRECRVYSLPVLVHEFRETPLLDLYTFFCSCPLVSYRAPRAAPTKTPMRRRSEIRSLEQTYGFVQADAGGAAGRPRSKSRARSRGPLRRHRPSLWRRRPSL